MIVCILGMHRSGTSVTARLLNLLGVYLGPDDRLIEPRPDNPKGFWEHRGIVEINKQLLDGPRRGDRPQFLPGSTSSPHLEDLRRRARAVIERDFAGAEIWGWKDPRTAVTLPFWQELLPEMVYVLCIRHPIHSARSLHARNGVPPVEGVHSWLVYVRSALQQTQGSPRLAVAYEDTIDDCLGTLARLAAFIGQPQRADWRDVKEAATTFVDPDLYHQRSDVAAETESDLPPKAISQLNRAYEVLREQGGLSGALPLLDTALATVKPEVKRRREQEASNWQHEIRLLSHEVGRVCQGEATTILVGQHELGDTPIPECRTIPFLERDGQYWGPPADDEIAIQELERLRRTGAAFIVFAWSAFWWLDYYAAFHRYLRSRYPCRLENDRLVAFDLGVA